MTTCEICRSGRGDTIHDCPIWEYLKSNEDALREEMSYDSSLELEDVGEKDNSKMYKCQHCGKSYAGPSGLWYHNKKCPMRK